MHPSCHVFSHCSFPALHHLSYVSDTSFYGCSGDGNCYDIPYWGSPAAPGGLTPPYYMRLLNNGTLTLSDSNGEVYWRIGAGLF